MSVIAPPEPPRDDQVESRRPPHVDRKRRPVRAYGGGVLQRCIPDRLGMGGPPPPPLGGARVVRAAGIHVQLPRGWYVTRRLIDDVSWPVQRFVVSSYPVPFDVSTAQTEYIPPETGVLAQIVEEAPALAGEHWPARPARPRLGRLGKMKLFGGDRWSELTFRLHGRHLYVFAWVGRDAPASTRQQLLTILDGMRVRAQ